jgi:hypothetical protein
MVLKTPARPARAPAGRKAVSARKTAKKATTTTAKPVATTTKAAKTKAASTATAKKTSAIRQRANARTPQMDGARTVEQKILGEAARAPIAVLLERVSGAIEDELNQIESMVSGRPMPLRQHGHAERRARMLASLARTLREVMQLRAGEEKAQRDDDAVPRDVNELRRELASRLERIVAETAPRHSGATE